MQNHIKMTKSFLQLLTKLESSIDTCNSSENVRDIGDAVEGIDGEREVGIRGEGDVGGEGEVGGVGDAEIREVGGEGGKESINISCSDIDNIYIQLTHKDELINKLKDIIVCKNDKITKLIKDINEVKKRNDYLEAKIIELTKTIKLLHENIDRNTLIIDLP
jgi:nitrogen regulatory protein PII